MTDELKEFDGITPLPWKQAEGEFGLMIENESGWDEATDADYGYIVTAANAYPALRSRVSELEEAISEAIKLLGMDRAINPSDVLRTAINKEPSHE